MGTGAVGRRLHLAGRARRSSVAVVLDPAALPQGPQGRDHLVQPLAPGGEVLPGLVELLLAPTHADPQPDAVVREDGGRAHRLGHRDQVAGRRHVDAGGEGQAGGHGGQAEMTGTSGRARRSPSPSPGRRRRGPSRCSGTEVRGVEEVVGEVHAGVARARRRPWPAGPPGRVGRKVKAWWKRTGLVSRVLGPAAAAGWAGA